MGALVQLWLQFGRSVVWRLHVALVWFKDDNLLHVVIWSPLLSRRELDQPSLLIYRLSCSRNSDVHGASVALALFSRPSCCIWSAKVDRQSAFETIYVYVAPADLRPFVSRIAGCGTMEPQPLLRAARFRFRCDLAWGRRGPLARVRLAFLPPSLFSAIAFVPSLSYHRSRVPSLSRAIALSYHQRELCS